MSNKSENHIIHITKDYEKLDSILLNSTLRLSYSKEDFKANGSIVSKAAHPMVCFSEYDIEEIDNKIITYGKYGIGFDKKWAREHNIGPVLYVGQNSLAAKGMAALLRARQNKKTSKLPDNLRLPIMELKAFIKNEIGYNSHANDNYFDFKTENEWRFVPKKEEIDNFYISQNQNTYNKNNIKHNEVLLKYPLRFKLDDVKVVFVSNKLEKDLIHNKYNIDMNIIRISKWFLKA